MTGDRDDQPRGRRRPGTKTATTRLPVAAPDDTVADVLLTGRKIGEGWSTLAEMPAHRARK